MPEFMAMASVRISELEDFFYWNEGSPWQIMLDVLWRPKHNTVSSLTYSINLLQSFPKPRLTMTMQKNGRGGENLKITSRGN